VQIRANARTYNVQEDERGFVDLSDVRETMGIGDGRELIAQRPEGSNQVLPSSGKYLVRPGELFTDLSIGVRGD